MRGIECLLLSTVLATLVSCSQPSEPQSFRWSASSGNPMPKASDLPLKEVSSVQIGKEKVIRSVQTVEGIPLRGGWVQTVHSQGGVIYNTSKTFSGDGQQWRVGDFSHSPSEALEELKRKSSELQSASRVFLPEPYYEVYQKKLEPVWVVKYIDGSETEAVELTYNKRLALKKRKIVSHDFADGRGTVYPGNPRTSDLTSVVLKELVGDGKLNSQRLEVSSALANAAFEPKLEFKYSPDDTRFHEVQAFYYIDQALGWLHSKVGFVLPFKLNVKVHVGAPNNTNAMFYYQRNIRLGQGDSLIYKDIPKDPSIVMHETMHGVVDAVAGLPFDGEAGSLNEAFADFLAANILGSPNMAEYSYLAAPYRRTLKNDFKAFRDFDGGLYHDSLVVSGTFWDVRNIIGAPAAAQYALALLARLGPEVKFKEFGSIALEVLEHQKKESHISPEDYAKLSSILENRGWISL